MQRLDKKQIKKMYKRHKRSQEIVLLLENVQYARNVAGIFRTADAAGVRKMILTGVSHQPPFGKDLVKASRHKEKSVQWEYAKDTGKAIQKLRNNGYYIVGIELVENAIELGDLKKEMAKHDKICFIAGSEVYGLMNSTLDRLDAAVQIPMFGKGASLNVGTSVGIVLYSL